MSDIVRPQQQSTPQPATTKPRRLLWIIPLPQRKPNQPASTAVTTTSPSEPTFYEKAIEVTHSIDKVINLALGYLLAVASVLGFMDVLSNGEVLTHVPAAFYIWLAVMGLGVDFQIFLVIGRFPDLTRQLNGWARVIFIIFNLGFLSFLCYMSATIGAVFTQHRDVANSTIVAAMNSLHIDATQFVYERAALATALLVLMAIDRTMERWRMQVQRDQVSNAQPKQTVLTTAQSQLSTAQLVLNAEDLAKQIREAVRSELEAIAQQRQNSAHADVQDFVQNATKVDEITQPVQQAVIAQRSTVHEDDEETAHVSQQVTQPVLHIVHSTQSTTQSVFDAASPAQAVQDNARQKVLAYLGEHPEHVDNNDAVMAGAGVNIYAARRYRGEYKKMQGGVQ